MTVYLVDFENVRSAGLKGVENLGEDDKVVIFYSKNADAITFDVHMLLSKSRAEIETYMILRGGRNSLDFQLSTYLGYLVMENRYRNIVIISADKGFLCAINFWDENRELCNVHITMRKSIEAFESNEPDDDVENELLNERYIEKISVIPPKNSDDEIKETVRLNAGIDESKSKETNQMESRLNESKLKETNQKESRLSNHNFKETSLRETRIKDKKAKDKIGAEASNLRDTGRRDIDKSKEIRDTEQRSIKADNNISKNFGTNIDTENTNNKEETIIELNKYPERLKTKAVRRAKSALTAKLQAERSSKNMYTGKNFHNSNTANYSYTNSTNKRNNAYNTRNTNYAGINDINKAENSYVRNYDYTRIHDTNRTNGSGTIFHNMGNENVNYENTNVNANTGINSNESVSDVKAEPKKKGAPQPQNPTSKNKIFAAEVKLNITDDVQGIVGEKYGDEYVPLLVEAIGKSTGKQHLYRMLVSRLGQDVGKDIYMMLKGQYVNMKRK